MVTTGARGCDVLGAVLGADEALLDVGLRHAAHDMAELLGDELSGIGVDHVGDLVHLAVLHQEFDDVDAALGHAVGELLDGDDLGDHDLALDLLLRLRRDLLLLALAVALQRGKASLALLLVERVGDGEAAAHAPLLAGPRLDGTLLLLWRASAVRGASSSSSLTTRCLRAVSSPLRRASASASSRSVFLLLALDRLLVLFRALLVGDDAGLGVLLGPLALLGLA